MPGMKEPIPSHLPPAGSLPPWTELDAALEQRGYALLPDLLGVETCLDLIALENAETGFRKTIEMARHAYGEGRYRYFAYPLPAAVQTLRERLYEHLLPLARAWRERLGTDWALPDTHDELLERCRNAGQRRPTPLVLHYGTDGHNRMHQDVYGAVAFPLQVTCLLSSPTDFEGGEFLVSETRARMQTRTEAIPLEQGEGIVFANTVRPVPGARGHARAQMRHGVSRVRSGTRHALGIIFHDAS
jgi:uncharacterized protein